MNKELPLPLTDAELAELLETLVPVTVNGLALFAVPEAKAA